jgi:hypothetical protein
VELFAALTVFLVPLSLAPSRVGRGDVLFNCIESYSSVTSIKPSVYFSPLIRAFPLPSRERARERGYITLERSEHLHAKLNTKNSELLYVCAHLIKQPGKSGT